MGSTKPRVCLVLLTLGILTFTEDICKNPIIKKLINGYYCPADTRTVKFSYVSHQYCTHYCVSMIQCSMFYYHVNKSMCFVHKQVCVEMVKDKEHVFSSIILYEPPKYECITWSPYQGNIPDDGRFVSMTGRNHPNMAIRLHRNSEILPGRFLLGKRGARTVSLLNGPVFGKEIANSAMEFLIVNDICSVSWVPYIAGNLMPSMVVVGGWRANGEPLFVASLWTTDSNMNSKYYYGYYDPISRLAYTYTAGVQTNSSLHIMVEN